MAYSNYGAYVTRDGEHRPDREDCGVWSPSLTEAGAEYGVLGDGTVKIVLGRPYRTPKVCMDGKPLSDMEVAALPRDGEWTLLDGHRFRFDLRHRFSHRLGYTVWATLVQPDGVKWVGECGAGFGAGYTNLPCFERVRVGRLPEMRWRRPVPCPRCGRRPHLSRVGGGIVRTSLSCGCGLCMSVEYGDEASPGELHLMSRRLLADWNALCADGRMPEPGWYRAGGCWVLVSDSRG